MNIKYCPECAKNKRTIQDPADFFAGYQLYFFQDKIGKTCQICDKDTLIETNITEDELLDFGEYSNYNPQFLKAMRELKEKDIIEYELKMSQFRTQVEQKNMAKAEEANLPKCPVCNSSNIEKISVGKKIKGSMLFGLFSNDAKKQMRCKDCGYKF